MPIEAKKEVSEVPGEVLSCGACVDEVPGMRNDGNRSECKKFDDDGLRRDSFFETGLKCMILAKLQIIGAIIMEALRWHQILFNSPKVTILAFPAQVLDSIFQEKTSNLHFSNLRRTKNTAIPRIYFRKALFRVNDKMSTFQAMLCGDVVRRSV